MAPLGGGYSGSQSAASKSKALAKKQSDARLQSFFDTMGSATPRRVTKGSEYDHPYYKQPGKGVPGQYTREQTMAASRAAQAFTYEDAQNYFESSGRRMDAGDTWAGKVYGPRTGGIIGFGHRPTKTGKMSNQDLYDMLGHMQKNAQPNTPLNPIGVMFSSFESDPYGTSSGGGIDEYKQRMKTWPGPGHRRWGDAQQMVQDGANYAAAAAYGEGRTARPSQVDVWEGVDRKPPKPRSYFNPSERRPTADHIIAQQGGVYAERGGALPGGVETLQREGKAQAGSRYRRKRSRSADMTEQPTAGSLLGGGGGGVLG